MKIERITQYVINVPSKEELSFISDAIELYKLHLEEINETKKLELANEFLARIYDFI